MKWAVITEAVSAVVPGAKALGVIVTLSVGAFMAGVGAVLGFGEYAGLPESVASLEVKEETTSSALATLRIEFDEAVLEAAADRQNILCLVRLTATQEVLSPLEVNARCP